MGLAGAGFFSLLGWLTYYRALEHGPVGIVSGAAATYGGVTAMLALIVLGEPLGRLGGLGGALAVAGVATAAMQTTGRPRAVTIDGIAGAARLGAGRGSSALAPVTGRGCCALVSAVTYGTGAFWLGTYAASAGWLVSALVVDIISVTVLAAALICRREAAAWRGSGWCGRSPPGWPSRSRWSRSRAGGQAGQIALTAAVSSTYPLIPLAFGLVLFRERLSTLQVMGVCVAVTGLTLVSMSSGLV